MQHKLFAALSSMFGREVPLYDRSLLVNRACNAVVCVLVGRLHRGFSISEEQLDRAGGERHGAIRIGRVDEYRWVGRFFQCFGMEPHNFYDMTSVGAKSQPVIATAFRSTQSPEHRVFTSLLMTDSFDDHTRARIEALLAERQVFSDRAKALVERAEQEGGLAWTDADALIEEATTHIFKWTGRARGKDLYESLCSAGFKIAADISCFESHHLNHLTPNTLAIDLYTAAMKYCLGAWEGGAFRRYAGRALDRIAATCDRDWMLLHFRHLTDADLAGFERGQVGTHDIIELVERLLAEFRAEPFQLMKLQHSGFKDSTEGPPADRPVFLRQDAYRALVEPVVFVGDDGTESPSVHAARFGEIEERWYACTPSGRAIYDACVAAAEESVAGDPLLARCDHEAYERAYAAPFAPVPTTLRALLDRGMAHARFAPTDRGLAHAAAGQPFGTNDLLALVDLGFVSYEGIRYEDFLPISAAGIFASNLSQYGTTCTAAVKPEYSQAQLEAILGRPIIDAAAAYAAEDSQSRAATLHALGMARLSGPASQSA
ncbi:MAG: DUF1338 family protein [Planctomycetota bacterium]|nr:DUF1338 family protein [Planctomycetota bacterium]MDA1106714.1 DUF1338 family protein [Planctomycetota bacterium]